MAKLFFSYLNNLRSDLLIHSRRWSGAKCDHVSHKTKCEYVTNRYTTMFGQKYTKKNPKKAVVAVVCSLVCGFISSYIWTANAKATVSFSVTALCSKKFEKWTQTCQPGFVESDLSGEFHAPSFSKMM